jgi:hypothetical protein
VPRIHGAAGTARQRAAATSKGRRSLGRDVLWVFLCFFLLAFLRLTWTVFTVVICDCFYTALDENSLHLYCQFWNQSVSLNMNNVLNVMLNT